MLSRLPRPVQEFINTEVFSGFVLLAAAVSAIVWANSPLDNEYADVFGHHIHVSLPFFDADESVQHWINDLLMAVFFYVVGLEIKRELLRGELRGLRRAALPGIAAFGGMVVPAAIFLALNAGGEGDRGWGIPMATDIAFALGLLALVGRRIPQQVRVFLLALAIVDDIGAIMVIAVFYTGEIQADSLLLAAAFLALIAGMQAAGLRFWPAYVAVALFAWAATYESGVHATIAGVALGLLTPFNAPVRLGTPQPAAELEDGHRGPLRWLEHELHPLTSFAILPLFALANAGVSLDPDSVTESFDSSVTLGVALGLFAGKPLGIFTLSWLAVRARIANLPTNATWAHMLGVGMLAGVGFTVALFVNELAFNRADLIEDGKLGIIGGSVLAGVSGLTWLTLLGRRGPEEQNDGDPAE